jgi:hypothetical protein
MKNELLKISQDLEQGTITDQKARKLLFGLLSVGGMLPLTKEHQCFERGHAFYLVCEIDNGRSKYGDHMCSRCGHVESFQYDYGIW